MKIVRTMISIFIAILCSLQLYAQESTSTHKQMAKISHRMLEIYPLISKNHLELNDKEIQIFKKNVHLIYQHIQDVDLNLSAKTDTSSVSMKTLQSHLASTQKALSNKNIFYAQDLMRSATNLCSGCHILDSKEKDYNDINVATKFFDSADLADFYYMTRNYRLALKHYQSQIHYGEIIRWGSTGYKAIKNSLVIFLQIDKDPHAATVFLEKIIKQATLDDGIKSEIDQWLQGIELIDKKKIPRTTPSFKHLTQYMNEVIFFNNDEQLYHLLQENQYPLALWLRGLINDYIKINNMASDEMPILLFWLASIDRSIEYDLYFSLADLYLKQCIIEYTDHPYAERCYALYEDYVYFSSTGSSGQHLAEEVKFELMNLQKILDKSH